MPYWAIYVTDPELHHERTGRDRVEMGTLADVVGEAPSLSGLALDGLGVSYFGEDPPDLTRLAWCPRRLSFVARTERGDIEGRLAVLQGRLRAVEVRLAALTAPGPTLQAPGKREPQPGAWSREPGADAPRARGWWARLKAWVRKLGDA